MPKIESLTPEQTARFPEFLKRWNDIGLCTEPANREQAERGIREMYRAAGIPGPERIVWCGSPLSQGMTRALVLDERFRASVWDSVWDSVGASVWASVGASVWDSVRASVWDSVWDSVWASVRASVWASVGASVWDSVRDSVYGQHDASWLAFYEYFQEVCGLNEQTQKLAGLWLLARSAGWAIPHQRICWVSERHNILRRDERGLLHSASGPAVAFPDGWAIYAVHGVRIPAEWVESPGELSPQKALTWTNVEQRRAAIELLGWNKVIAQLNPVVVNKSRNPEIGTLLRADLPDAPGSQFLQVRCGTGREFVLPVPPDVKTAREANAWTYGMTPREYRPQVRT